MKKETCTHFVELKASLEYLSQYMKIDEITIFEIGSHCGRYALIPNICAWYKDMEDFYSDWCGIGFTRKEATDLFYKDEERYQFQTLKNGNIIRYAL